MLAEAIATPLYLRETALLQWQQAHAGAPSDWVVPIHHGVAVWAAVMLIAVVTGIVLELRKSRRKGV